MQRIRRHPHPIFPLPPPDRIHGVRTESLDHVADCLTRVGRGEVLGYVVVGVELGGIDAEGFVLEGELAPKGFEEGFVEGDGVGGWGGVGGMGGGHFDGVGGLEGVVRRRLLK